MKLPRLTTTTTGLAGPKVILIVNTGTPDSPRVRDVRKYLSAFLNDRRVIDIPWLFRTILVNFIIIPFRASHSARRYGRLWTVSGSPLRTQLENLVSKLTDRMDGSYVVTGAMRYGNPSLKSALERIKKESFSEIVVFPLFPHYASSTTGSIMEFILKTVSTWNFIPKISCIDQFYSHPAFIESYVALINRYDPGSFDHIVFSYHGLPLNHIKKMHPGRETSNCDCIRKMPDHGSHCYKAVCYETTRLLAEKLGLKEMTYSTSFQSGMSEKWIKPFTIDLLKELAGSGKRRVLVVAPSFVADCLETLVEIGEEYHEQFLKEGGTELVVAESLNDNDEWISALAVSLFSRLP